ncbi:hypothetical protein Shyhy01_72790 [Streptomyces hygroscopicus subsp. hygroscopicus]|nr:hypothetical protein Shyhy01_72790 [Streptomyces hygroscopicus subsp. hygroscopicus]
MTAARAPGLTVPAGRGDDLIAHDPLLSDDATAWLGTAALLRAPCPAAARALLTRDRYADIEVHARRFGGRGERRTAHVGFQAAHVRRRTARIPAGGGPAAGC